MSKVGKQYSVATKIQLPLSRYKGQGTERTKTMANGNIDFVQRKIFQTIPITATHSNPKSAELCACFTNGRYPFEFRAIEILDPDECGRFD
jgi:hypothetical protein